jgi:toxin YoeB
MKNKKAENKQQARTAAVSWTDNAWEEYISWQKEDLAIVDVINGLIEECLRHPFTGTGKPEPLRANLTGFWSGADSPAVTPKATSGASALMILGSNKPRRSISCHVLCTLKSTPRIQRG